MMGSHPDCNSTRLQGLLDDTLTDDQERAVLDHLGACEACQRRIEHLAADGGWWEDLRRFAPRESTASDAWNPAAETRAMGPGEAFPCPQAEGDEVSLGFLAPSDDPRFVGRLGRYEVTGVVGRGGMGLVLKAFDPPLNRFVAVKVLAPELATSGAARKRFAREAKAAAAVAHEHVVPIYAVDEAGGLPYLVMPYIAGRSLRERIERDGPLGVEEVLRVGMQAAQGLASAHAQGLVHRDVKPANILLENGVERVKLTDFGLARAVDDAGITQSGVVTGTPEYMSPEQARGEPVDHRSDLFSLGGVLYACCTGHAPFRAGTSLAVLKRVCEGRQRPIRESNPALPGWLEEIVDRLLEKDPADRFSSAAEVADLLGRQLARAQNPALPAVDHPWVHLRHGRGTRRRWLAGVGATLAGTALLAGWRSRTHRALAVREPGPTPTPTPTPAVRDRDDRATPPVETGADQLGVLFCHDFRGARFDERALRVARWNTDGMIQPEPEGLRVTIPASDEVRHLVGVATRFRVRGDFEITASYEVLESDTPRDGFGLGFGLSVAADSPGKITLNLENSEVPTRAGDGDGPGRFFNATLVSGPPGSRTYSPRTAPAKVKGGRMRVTRSGSTACAFYSEGGPSFQLLRQVEFGSEDLIDVVVGAYAGGSGHAVDVLIRDLIVRAEGLPGLADLPPIGPDAPERHSHGI